MVPIRTIFVGLLPAKSTSAAVDQVGLVKEFVGAVVRLLWTNPVKHEDKLHKTTITKKCVLTLDITKSRDQGWTSRRRDETLHRCFLDAISQGLESDIVSAVPF